MKALTICALLSALALCVTAAAVRAADQGAAKKPRACTPEQKDPQRHKQFLKDKEEALKKGPVQLVFVGDSITDAWRGGPQNKLFVERWGKHNPYNIGISGDETQHVLWRIENGELDGLQPKLVVMMIGTNNIGNSGQSPEDTAAGVKCLVEAIRRKLPQSKILLLGVFPRGQSPSDPHRARIRTINETISLLDDGQWVHYLDLGSKFLDAQGNLPADVMPDALHPNEQGYRIWADAMGPVIEHLMK